jgi:hypothetical protein
LTVAEIGAVATATDAAGHSRLFNGFANEDAIFFELLGQDGVEERIAARIEWQNENGEDFGFLERNELQTGCGSQRKKSDGRPAKKVSEHKESHSFGNPRVVRIPRL